MKKILYILSISLVLSSCTDFLEEDNKGGITSSELYSTEQGYEALVASAYATLRTMYGEWPWLWVAGTDLYQISRKDDNHGIQRYLELQANDPNVLLFYQRAYAGIQVVNTALHYGALGPVMDATRLRTRMAEMRFLRAFYHFLLVEQFGGIVINRTMTEAPRLEMPRASLAESYQFIISEMEAALPDLPALATPRGRVDQQVVRHYLAKVYLTRGYDLDDQNDFIRARDLALEVIAGRTITIPFADLWSPTNENNAEVIFAVQYDPASMPDPMTSGNMQQALFAPYLRGPEGGHKFTDTQLPTTWHLHNLFSRDDARYNVTFMNTVYSSYWDFYTMTPAALQARTIIWFYGRNWAPDGITAAPWTSTDTDAWRAINPTPRAATRVWEFPVSEADWKRNWHLDGAIPAVRKFDSPATRTRWSIRASSRDIVLARLAETFFIAAEAYLELGQPALAANMVNTVRRRPGNSLVGGNLPDLTNMTIDVLLQESAREFVGEYLRWPELRRTGKLIEYALLYNPDVREIGRGAFIGVDGQDKIYRPIPEQAMMLNPALVQNPGFAAPQ